MRTRRLLVLAAVLGVGSPVCAAAAEVKLWPLFRYASQDGGETMRWSALGPFIEFTRTRDHRDLRIRPLLWVRQRRGSGHDDRAEILFPLAATRWQDDYQSFRFLLFTFRTSAAPSAAATPAAPAPEWATRFTLFPFVFYRRSPERGTRLGVMPFYLDLDDFLGYERFTAVMFPAYLRLTEARLERRWWGFPLVSTLGGPDGRGVRVWPLFGTSEIRGAERTRYVLWPFHIRRERLVPGWGWERRRVNFPVFGAIDGAGRRSRAWGVVAYTHTVDERRGTESTGAPWPLVVRERRLGDAGYRVWRLAPFYGRTDVDGVSSRFWAWPAYRRKRQRVDDFRYERLDVGGVLWRRQTLASDTTGRDEWLLTAFPLLRAEEHAGRRFGQVPALADSLLPRNRGVLTLWAPLYAWVRWDTRPTGARDWSLLWGLVAREDRGLRGPWHLDLESAPPAAGSSDGA
jgi:hypothetical protein